MHRIHMFLAGLAMLVASSSFATVFSSDATDLWWNPQESGWGVNVIQQGNVLFATFFVYGADGKAHWFVASDMEGIANNSPSPGHSYTFSGTLYETQGPAFFQTFNPESVVRRAAGSATFTYVPPGNATLTYTVDGVTVNKEVVRQTWRAADFSGNYHVSRNVDSSCGVTQAGFSGAYIWLVTQSGGSVTIESHQGNPLQCIYTGSIVQQGHFAIISGTANCPSLGGSQPFAIDQLQINNHGFTGRITVSEVGCTLVGNVVGVNDIANGPN